MSADDALRRHPAGRAKQKLRPIEPRILGVGQNVADRHQQAEQSKQRAHVESLKGWMTLYNRPAAIRDWEGEAPAEPGA